MLVSCILYNMTDIQRAIEDYKIGLSIKKSASKNKVSRKALRNALLKDNLVRKGRSPVDYNVMGQQFGSWKVLNKSNRLISGNIAWVCECKCGKVQEMRRSDLLKSKTGMCLECATTGKDGFLWKG